MPEFTGKITKYSIYNTQIVLDHSIRAKLQGDMLRGVWRKKYPVGTRVRVEIDANNYVKSMIDAPVKYPFVSVPLPEPESKIEVHIYDIREGFTSYGN